MRAAREASQVDSMGTPAGRGSPLGRGQVGLGGVAQVTAQGEPGVTSALWALSPPRPGTGHLHRRGESYDLCRTPSPGGRSRQNPAERRAGRRATLSAASSRSATWQQPLLSPEPAGSDGASASTRPRASSRAPSAPWEL